MSKCTYAVYEHASTLPSTPTHNHRDIYSPIHPRGRRSACAHRHACNSSTPCVCCTDMRATAAHQEVGRLEVFVGHSDAVQVRQPRQRAARVPAYFPVPLTLCEMTSFKKKIRSCPALCALSVALLVLKCPSVCLSFSCWRTIHCKSPFLSFSLFLALALAISSSHRFRVCAHLRTLLAHKGVRYREGKGASTPQIVM